MPFAQRLFTYSVVLLFILVENPWAYCSGVFLTTFCKVIVLYIEASTTKCEQQ